jgi:putative membrane protein
MMWGSGYGSWWMGLSMMVFWGGVVLLIIWAVRRGSAPAGQSASKAIEILEERLARGEIDLDEFEKRRAALKSG